MEEMVEKMLNSEVEKRVKERLNIINKEKSLNKKTKNIYNKMYNAQTSAKRWKSQAISLAQENKNLQKKLERIESILNINS